MVGLASSSAPAKATLRASTPARKREAVATPMPPPPRPYRFTVDDYYRMGEAGILKEDSRVELIEGEVVMLPPIDFDHAQGTHRSEKRLDRLLGDKFDVRCQHPVRLSAISEPVPDVSVVKLKSYCSHPTPEDTLLILEIANSSLKEDLGRKKLMYAAAAIPEYWVLDLKGKELHVFTRPKRGDYTEHRVLAADESVQSTTLKALKVKVAELLP